MRDLIKKELRILSEAKSWIEEHCDNAFGERAERYFCYAATNVFKTDKDLQKTIENFLRMFFDAFAKEIKTLKWQKLTSEHKVAADGIEELEWVKKNGKELCPEIENNIKKILIDLGNGVYVYYADPITGDYHLLNRLNTNYSALAVMVTEYFRQTNALDVLKNHIHSTDGWKTPTKKMIEWLVKLNSEYPIPIPNEENLFKNAYIKFNQKPLSRTIFKDLISNLESDISKKTHKVLHDVREVGFSTERKFISQLEKYGITYKNFGKDYGFVDRFLGIDLFVKLDSGWYPVQVKSSAVEHTLITKLGCEGALVVYPDKNGNFWIGDISFERFFCKMNKACKEKNEKISE